MRKFFIEKNSIILVVLNTLMVLLMIINSMYPESLALNSFLLPVPFAIMYALYEKRITITLTIINAVFTVVITQNIILSLISVFIVIILGIIIGKSIKEKKGVGVSLLEVIITTIILSASTIIFYLYFIENTGLKEIVTSIRQLADVLLNEASKIQDKGSITLSAQDVLVNIPSLFIMYYAINSLINYFIAIKVVSMLKKEKVYLKPFAEYYISNIIGALFIVLLCIGLILDNIGFSIGSYISTTFYFMLDTLLIINGVACSYNFLINKFKYNKAIGIIIIIGWLLIIPDALVVLGFVEMIVDFRKLDPHRIFKKR